MDTNIKYLKDEVGNIISPVVNTESIFTSGGGRLVDYIYPVGSIYMSVNSTDPAVLFGGTWEQLKDKFLLSAGDSYTAGDTGGAATVTLTTSQIPSHTHTFTGTAASHTHTFTGSSATTSSNGAHTHEIYHREDNTIGSSATRIGTSTSNNGTITSPIVSAGAHTHTLTAKGSNSSTSITPQGTNSSTGGGSSHNNMPPYLVVYVWKRVS